MFFKNCLIYRINRNFRIADLDLFEQQLSEFKFTSCGPNDKQKFGWVTPLGQCGSLFSHLVGNNLLICAKKEEKILPASVVKEKVNERINMMESEYGMPLKKRDKDNIKDDIITELLPQAFTRSEVVRLLIMQDLGFIIVDTGSSKKAEDVLALLRKTIGSLPVVPVMVDQYVNEALTAWVKSGETPKGFTLLDSAEFTSINGDKSTVKCKNQELHSDEMIIHIESHKTVTKLALDWQDRISFTLTEDLYLKGVKYSDELIDQNEDIPREDRAARFDADMQLMCGEFSALLSDLFAVLGGVVE